MFGKTLVSLVLAVFCAYSARAAENDSFKSEFRKTRVGLEAWKGMKVAFLGDSITDPCHVGCTKNYWGFMIEDLDLDAKVYGVSGHQWSDVPGQINRIYEAKDAIEFFLAGATAVAVGTATFTNPGIVREVYDGIVEYCERKGFGSVRELTGALL